MAITVDATLARFSGSIASGGTVVSESFTPPDNSIIVLCIDADWATGVSGTDRAFSVSGGGLTWNSRIDSGQQNGAAAIWTAPVTTGASMTVTVSMTGQATNYTVTAKAYQVTGQHASPIGNSAANGSTTNNISPSLTAAGAGRLFGAGTDWNALGTPTSTDTEDAAHFAGLISVMSAFKAADHVSGSQSINFDAATTSAADWRYALLEILAAAGGGTTHTQSVSGGLTPAGALARRAAKLPSGTAASSGALNKQTRRALTGSLSTAGALAAVKTALLSIAGSLSSAGALTKRAGKSASATLPSSGALVKQARRAITGAIASAGALASVKAALLSIAGTLTSSGSVVRRAGKVAVGSLASSGVLTKQPRRALTATIASSGALSAIRTILKALTGSMTSSGTLTRRIAKSLSGALQPAGGIVKQIARALAGSLACAGTIEGSASAGIPADVRVRFAARIERGVFVAVSDTDRFKAH